MMNLRNQVLALVLCAALLLSACQGASAPTAPAGQPPSAATALENTPTSSPTPAAPPPATSTPLPTATATLAPTPTPLLPVAIGTPLSFTPAAISLENAAQLRQLKSWGRGVVRELAVSPDGTLVVAAFASGIGLFDAETLEQTGWIDAAVFGISLSDDGKLIAGGGNDHLVHVWGVDGQELHTFKGHQDSVTSVAFIPGGQQVVSGSNDKTVKVWSLAESKAILTLEGHQENISRVAVSADGKLIASGDMNAHIILWEAAGGAKLYDLRGQSEDGYVAGLAFAPKGELLASVDPYEGTLRLWNTANGRVEARLTAKQMVFESVAFSLDGKTVAVGSDTGFVQMFDVATKKASGKLEGHTTLVNTLAFTPDGWGIISGSSDETLRAWRVSNKNQTAINEVEMKLARGLSLLPDGKTLAYAAMKKHIYLISLEDGKRIKDIPYPTHEAPYFRGYTFSLSDSVYGITLSSDGSLFVPNAILSNYLSVYQLDGGKLLKEVNTYVPATLKNIYGSIFNASAISGDNKLLAGGNADGLAYVWNIADGKLVYTLKGSGQSISKVAFSPDGQVLAAADIEGLIRLWNMNDGSLLREISGHEKVVNALAFSPDGKLLASVSDDEKVHITNVEDGSLLQDIQGHEDGDSAVAFSPDGALLAAGSSNGALTLWKVADGSKVADLQGHTARLDTLIFTPDGLYLISAGQDGVTRMWGVMP